MALICELGFILGYFPIHTREINTGLIQVSFIYQPGMLPAGLSVTVSNIHRIGKRENSAAIDEPVKRSDPGPVLVGSLKDRDGTLGSL
jgi:hypothetical protein